VRVREAVAEGADGDEGAGCFVRIFVFFFRRGEECKVDETETKKSPTPTPMNGRCKKNSQRFSPIASLLALPSEPRRTARTFWMSTDFAQLAATGLPTNLSEAQSSGFRRSGRMAASSSADGGRGGGGVDATAPPPPLVLAGPPLISLFFLAFCRKRES